MRRLIFLAALFGAAAGLFANSPHTFVYHPSDHPRSVDIAGTFNNWSDTANPMSPRADGSFTATLSLPDGIYQYKLVINHDRWIGDPNSDKELEDSADEHHNSAVMVGPDARHEPTPPSGTIDAKFVIHDPHDTSDVNVATPHLLRLRLRTMANNVDSVTLRTWDGPKESQQPMYKISTTMGLDTWACFAETNAHSLNYVLELHDGASVMNETVDGLKPRKYMRGSDAFHVNMTPAFETPDWAKNAVWYQIFPERFRNGDPANDPPNTKRWQSKWYSTLPGEVPGEENFYHGAGNVWQRRYGGDVQGLIWALPYLKSLGITAIYLNPMFEADSLHKYDTSDYRHIDEHFGFAGDIEQLHGETDDPATWQWTKTDKLFLDFVAKAHAMGFHVILDGVFNHVGRDFWAFRDVLKNGKHSKYAGWFDIRDWHQPIKYIAWDRDGPSSDGALPILKKDPVLGLVHGPREHVLAIAKRWLAPDGDPSRGVDGFRLDVANDVPHPFWQEFRRELKALKPDCYISGEIWTWAQPWLQGNEFDAVMNYRFAVAMQDFYVRQKKAISPSTFNARLNEMIYAYPLQVSLDQMNLLDSHDTDRFASMIVNSDLGFKEASRLQEPGGDRYSIAKPDATQMARMKQALVTQFTFLGAPMIYYGDEVGMWSADDPSNRQPMVWKDLEPYDDPQVKFNQDLFDWYQRLIAIRNSHPALRLGFYRPVLMDDVNGMFVYARDLGDEKIYIVINRSAKSQTAQFDVFPTIYEDALTHRRTGDIGSNAGVEHLTWELKPYSSAILVPAD
ncbi:MAG TPA: alpha amylase N-terminal ig-like domain-containing protein [Tepidisphaeraceae bacterium]|jgi:glycosidase